LVHVVTPASLDRQVVSVCRERPDNRAALVPPETLDHVEVLEHRDLLVSREILDSLVQPASKELLVKLVRKEPLVDKASLDSPECQVGHVYMYTVDFSYVLTYL